jgi:transposase
MTTAVDNIMSRAEKEKKVLDLYYNQSKGYDKIAKELHLSFTTINDIIKRDRQQKERQQTEMKRSNIIDDGNGNGNGNGKAEQQQHQIIPTISATTSASASLSQTQLEELSDKQKAVMAYKLYD